MIQKEELSPVDLDRGCMIAGKIAECHEAANKLFGDDYHEKTQPIRSCLEELVEKLKCGPISAGIELLRFLKEKGDLNAVSIMLVCAVVYEIHQLTKEK